MTADRTGPYRSRSGRLLGVLKGLAQYAGLPVLAVRVLFVILTLATGIWPGVGLYLLAALLLKPEPILEPESPDARDFYESYVASPRSAGDRLRRKMDSLDRRIRRIEDAVTSREYDWERRMNGK
ncbi:phage shock protein C, PspC [Desulfovibrio sp. X2]|uniref:PspC domain-containing protein n=1 Tax=Desulfovibrio sp. X2 TaxID=941449 RepID=UPI000358858B|nr:PspC domain-containing protein [Desulfovibrio sp. X2]EPR41822.1 phage shock protein C, PspC [Desulfovibrio sp. X2]